MIKVKSTIPVIATPSNGMAYITREMVRLSLDLKQGIYTPVMLEQIFVYESDETRKIVNEKFREYGAKPLTVVEVNGLFSILKRDILSTDDFDTKFKELLLSALVFDTKGLLSQEAPMYGLTAEQWEIDTI